ncbi:dirigent protein 23 [Trifolium pratense]|uniref:dirigent protein 23 n=1 Tax=Trifolium pratense TaxID=57577 RepID=UPI001E692028|nr:dirigent protein 23 [Trifolium pratense]
MFSIYIHTLNRETKHTNHKKMSMSKQNVLVLALLLMFAMLLPPIQSLKLKAGNWGKTFPKKNQESETNLQFYFHDTLSGKNPSVVKIAEPLDKTQSYVTRFGTIFMADDPLTETYDPKSKLVGRAQGIYASSCQQEIGLLMSLSYVFVDGPYNGSTFTLVGKNSAANPVREMPIVGGTGLFRMARGYAIAKTHWVDLTTGDAIVGYNVTLIH